MLSKKLDVANLPTPIHKLEHLSQRLGKEIYIKRDDYTGTEISGNKVRKLEYTIQYVIDHGYDTIITTGAITSNHARATAALCAKYQIECHLVLKGTMKAFEGNLFLDAMFGAHIHVIDDNQSREIAMTQLRHTLEGKNKTPFMIPTGASDWIGTHGYINAFEEILRQEAELGCHFDSINVAVGSGGTYAGLWFGKHSNKIDTKIIGYAVNESAATFKNKVQTIINHLDESIDTFDTITINDCYIGLGYAQATDEELAFYIDIAQLEGIVLDPTYTGKAFRGMVKEIQAGKYDDQQAILFIHTGGLQGYTEETRTRIQQLLPHFDNNL
ncbi:D-cysteine desulfhydrase family protein [Staphylococcus cohnii]|uniref:D-cysteine desulfhydrase family protein n=1 Tax=Staphylococcus TaxID=1279 RepID=UPI0007D8D0DF|nr:MULTISPECIES: D-cysteine desulfhydrase family protein [Staphylococcus]AQM41190.1 D-cysteine desulfhydrase [Staphylococcus cohnii]MCQ9294018.1 D-cysteine desulfhydrase family protein [Staphylococcus cohnii]OAO21821.1 cysteine desulfhydrase [Staphylococcus cohnii]PTF09803.1 D-cysteine desulfhydrase family protein [Staphylococcus cohnii]PTF42409.1 D-cysteine desulfhydrase family protein [Staphylococcus cohnii]